MNLDELLTKKLLIVSGKGGVGRTTLSLLLALYCAKNNKNVCLVEMSTSERIAPYFGLKSLGYSEVSLAPRLSGIHLTPSDCFEEYIVRQIKFKKLFDTFVNNKFVTYFLNAVPGFNELLMIGKIHDLVVKRKADVGTGPEYDMVIVDGPATGHGVSAFEVPQIVSKAVSMGPLKSQSESILKLIKDPDKCVFCPVTLGEEMPVQECLELVSNIKSKLGISLGPVFFNQFHASPFISSEEEKIEAGCDDIDLGSYYLYGNLKIQKSRMHAHYRDLLLQKWSAINLIPYRADLEPKIESLQKLLEEAF